MELKMKRAQSGQAAVESALVLPLTVFMVLGTLQMFMMLHGRIMAEYAVFRATRAGSVNQADCRVMTHAAVASLLPTFTDTSTPTKLGLAWGFGSYRFNAYSPLDKWGTN